MRWAVFAAALAWFTLLAGAASASASQLLYYGGPVVHSANVVLVDWGPAVRTAYTDPSTGDPAFFRYLSSQNGSTSDIGGVLAQYMDTTGHNSQNAFRFSGTFHINPAVAPTPPGKVLDSDIQTVLGNQIHGGALPSPAGNGLSTIYVVLFPPGDNVCFDASDCAFGNNGGFCAYHGSFQLSGSSTQVLYAAMVDNGPGTANFGACGVGATDLATQTAVVSHEVAETINDPLDSVTSWYDYTFNGEIADKCDAQPAGHNGPWTVEPLWSNLDQGCAAAEAAYHAPTASFSAPSTGKPGQAVSFNASASTDPAADKSSALDQSNGLSFSISSGIVTYRWNWGDGSAGTASSTPTASHAFAKSGSYEVSLTVTDRLGFTSTKTQQVSVGAGTPGTPIVSTGTATGLDNQGHATLNGTVNPEGTTTTYHFLYGTDPSNLQSESATPVTAGPSDSSTHTVSASLSGLTPGTTYYYELEVTSASNTYTGGVQSFTIPNGAPPPPQPMVATGTAKGIGSSNVTVTGTVDPEGQSTTYQFLYGKSASTLQSATPASTGPSDSATHAVSAAISGLSPSTTYYYRLVVRANGNTYAGDVQSFTTSALLSIVYTGGASNIRSTSGVVWGWVNPRGQQTIFQVQFGRTAAYGYSSTWVIAGSGNAWKHVYAVVLGLQPQTTYHYRFVAQNRHGTVVGSDRTFTTASAPGFAPRFRLSVASRKMTWSQLTSGPLHVRFSCSKSCLAHFILVARPPGMDRLGALPMTLARGQASLAGGRSGSARIRLSSEARGRIRAVRKAGLELLVLGYAASGGSPASPPQEARIKLTG